MENLNFRTMGNPVDQECAMFRLLAGQVADLGASIGVRIVPFRDSSLPHFAKRPADQRTRILKELSTYVRICEATMSEGAPLNNSARLLWNAIKEFKLRPVSDLFNFVGDGRVIEIHNTEYIQIFRNFEFYSCCSYSLEELYCFPWTYLYSRNETVENHMIKVISSIFEGKIQHVVEMGLDPYIIKELYSPFQFEIKAHMKYIAPLFEEGSGQIGAHILIEDGEVGNFPTSPDDEQRLLADYYKLGLHQTHSLDS